MSPATTQLSTSARVQSIKPSVTVAFGGKAKAMKAAGIDVLSFSLGEPDFDTPEPIKQAAIEALLAGQTKYMPTLGDAKTRQAIADKLAGENGIPGLTADHIAISAGGKHSLYVCCHCLLDPPEPGEDAAEVIIPVPAWVSYAPIAQMAGDRLQDLSRAAPGGHHAPDAPADAQQPEQPVRHDVLSGRTAGSRGGGRRGRGDGRPGPGRPLRRDL